MFIVLVHPAKAYIAGKRLKAMLNVGLGQGIRNYCLSPPGTYLLMLRLFTFYQIREVLRYELFIYPEICAGQALEDSA